MMGLEKKVLMSLLEGSEPLLGTLPYKHLNIAFARKQSDRHGACCTIPKHTVRIAFLTHAQTCTVKLDVWSILAYLVLFLIIKKERNRKEHFSNLCIEH